MYVFICVCLYDDKITGLDVAQWKYSRCLI